MAYIQKVGKDSAAAAKWLDELEEAVLGLAELPHRFRVIDEQKFFSTELRQLLHYSHRVIFHIDEDTSTVHILRVYHGRRDTLRPENLA